MAKCNQLAPLPFKGLIPICWQIQDRSSYYYSMEDYSQTVVHEAIKQSRSRACSRQVDSDHEGLANCGKEDSMMLWRSKTPGASPNYPHQINEYVCKKSLYEAERRKDDKSKEHKTWCLCPCRPRNAFCFCILAAMEQYNTYRYVN